jgi:hypothetical protein
VERFAIWLLVILGINIEKISVPVYIFANKTGIIRKFLMSAGQPVGRTMPTEGEIGMVSKFKRDLQGYDVVFLGNLGDFGVFCRGEPLRSPLCNVWQIYTQIG